MTEVNLFTLAPGRAIEIPSQTMQHEKPLQELFERNLEKLLGARFLASEFQAGEYRIDTLGLDDAHHPVIVEYKRRKDESIITQGLSYLDWVKKNPASIKWQVLETLGRTAASKINFSAPRLICVASEFNNKDLSAASACEQDIQLVRYRKFGEDLLMLEHLNSTKKKKIRPAPINTSGTRGATSGHIPQACPQVHGDLKALYANLKKYLNELGTDVQERKLKHYVVFARKKNFASLSLQRSKIRAFAYLDPDSIALVPGFTRDLQGKGKLGSGNIEITISSEADLERAKPLFRQAYAVS